MPQTRERHCIRCGSTGPFSNPTIQRCQSCESQTNEQRKRYHRTYHKARNAAMKKLMANHGDEYRALLTVELRKGKRKLAAEERELAAST